MAAGERSSSNVAVTCGAAAAPFAVAALVWALAAPAPRAVSLGDGTGVPTFGSDGVTVSATLVLSLLLTGAGAAAAILVWRRHPAVRGPLTGLACWAGIGALGAAAAVVAVWCGKLFHTQGLDAAHGTVVDLSPRLTRQVWISTAADSWPEHLAYAGWAMAGAVATWFVAAYSSVASDLR